MGHPIVCSFVVEKAGFQDQACYAWYNASHGGRLMNFGSTVSDDLSPLLWSEIRAVESMTTFDSTKESLLDLLQSIKQAKTQLPDFQRGWVWDDDHIRSLLASVSLSFPIGAVMMLQTGNPDVRFKPRLVEGLELANPPEPERLILDGQQRLTSLFLALLSGAPVQTRDRRDHPIKRWYYLDIARAIQSQR